MSIDLNVERPITFNRAARYLPRSSRPNQSTWWRWWRHGVRGIQLETVLIGGRRYTTREAVLRFAAALTSITDSSPPTSFSPGRIPVPSNVEAALDQAGIK